MAKEIKLCQNGQSYWQGTGVYQKEYDDLYERLVPKRGCADTIAGEMVRGVSRLYYDYFNNGNCNVVDVKYDDDDCIVSARVDDYYQKFFVILKQIYTRIHFNRDEEEIMENAFKNLREVEKIIIDCGEQTHSFSSKADTTYDNMADYCIYVVLNHPDLVSGKLPDQYRNDF